MNAEAVSSTLQWTVLIAFASYGVSALSTDPPAVNGGTVDLPAVENAANVPVFCEVTFSNALVTTVWFLRNGTMPQERIFFGQPQFANFMAVPGTQPVATNITIVSFSRANLHMIVLECSNNFPAQLQNAFFTPRFIEPPVLREEPAVMIGVENSDAFSFNISQSLGYPPDPSQNSERATLTYQWFHEGVAINTTTSTNPNVSVYPEITFNPALRTQSGNYSMTASTEGGDSTGYFILDVQYAVEADISASSQFCVPVGGSVSLVAFINIDGNPDPTSSWELIGGTLMGDTTGRQLNISDLELTDSGNYTNTLTNTVNGTENRMSRTIELRVLSSPTAPRMLSVVNMTDDSSTSTIFQWQNPSSSGVPAFYKFLVELVSMTPPFINISRTVTATSTDPSYINTFTVTGLKPNTNYTASVRTVSSLLDMSCMEQGVDLPGPISNKVSFMTMLGDPEFTGSSVENIAGKFNVTWGFRHTGGAPLTRVMVSCVSTDEEGSNDGDAIICTGNSLCGDVSNDGMVLLPSGSDNVTAGMNYSCTVTATNNLGNSAASTTGDIIAVAGVPSTPVITNITTGTRRAEITIRLYCGFKEAMVTIRVTNSSMSYDVTRPISCASSDLKSYTLMPINLSPGTYQFIVSARNIFGVSDSSDAVIATVPDQVPASSTFAANPIVTLSASTTMPTEPIANNSSAGVIAGAVVAVVAIILIIPIVLLIVGFLIYRNKGQPKNIQTADNEAYGVLRGGGEGEGGGVSQSIELQDNAAYSAVNVHTAHNRTITMDTNAAYGVTSVKADHVYEIPNIQT